MCNSKIRSARPTSLSPKSGEKKPYLGAAPPKGVPKEITPQDEANNFLNKCAVKPLPVLTPEPGIDGLRSLAKRRDWIRLIKFEGQWAETSPLVKDDVRVHLEFKVIFTIY